MPDEREEILNNIIKFLERLNYFELVADENKFEEFIQSLTVEQFKNLLVTFNAKLRNIPNYEKGTYSDGTMLVGEWKSPTTEVQEKMLNKLLIALKELKNNKDRATLAYYMLIDLHMFEDGNGRTSRFFYDLISGETNFIDKLDWYIHNEYDSRKNRSSFENEVEIVDISDVNWWVSHKIPKIADKYSISLDPITHYGRIRTFGEFIIPDNIEMQLTEKEIRDIKHLLSDTNGRFTVSGFIIVIISAQKGQLNRWLEFNDDRINDILANHEHLEREYSELVNETIFSIEKNKEMFDSWTVEDYRKVISIGNDIKEFQLTHLIRVFTNPDNYLFSDGKTFKQAIYTENKKNKEI